MSFTLNQKLEMIKLNEEGIWSKALLCQTVRQVVNAKEKFLRAVNAQMIINSLFADMETVFHGLDRRSNQQQQFLKPKPNPE